MVKQGAQWSRSDGSELWFGDAVAQGGLDGGPGVGRSLLAGGLCRGKGL